MNVRIDSTIIAMLGHDGGTSADRHTQRKAEAGGSAEAETPSRFARAVAYLASTARDASSRSRSGWSTSARPLEQ